MLMLQIADILADQEAKLAERRQIQDELSAKREEAQVVEAEIADGRVQIKIPLSNDRKQLRLLLSRESKSFPTRTTIKNKLTNLKRSLKLLLLKTKGIG